MISLPCNFDHNGECLVCDCWVSDCAWWKMWGGDFKYNTLDELIQMFKDHLTEDDIAKLKETYKC